MRRATSILLVATPDAVLRIDPEVGSVSRAAGLEGQHPSSLAADPFRVGRAWCATRRGGVFHSDDGGASWSPSDLAAGTSQP